MHFLLIRRSRCTCSSHLELAAIWGSFTFVSRSHSVQPLVVVKKRSDIFRRRSDRTWGDRRIWRVVREDAFRR